MSYGSNVSVILSILNPDHPSEEPIFSSDLDDMGDRIEGLAADDYEGTLEVSSRWSQPVSFPVSIHVTTDGFFDLEEL